MDAKPQRPRASWRVRDENLPPTNVPPTKSIHQRNRSTPALSALLQLGANKTGLKRTAFADVSNTVGGRQAQQTAKDDSVLPGKRAQEYFPLKTLLAPLKEVRTKEVVDKPTNQLRPAQRALNTLSHKLTVTNATTSSVNTAAEPGAPKAKTVVKLSTAGTEVESATELFIKKDAVAKHVSNEVLPSAAVLEVRDNTSLLPSTDPTPVFTVTSQPGQTSSIPPASISVDSHSNGVQLTTATVQAATADALLKVTQPSLISEFNVDHLIPLTYSEGKPEGVPNATKATQDLLEAKVNESGVTLQAPIAASESHVPSKVNHVHVVGHEKPARRSTTLPLGEGEEDWDEDEEEDYYDADAYTTVRSIQSRSNTTTGGMHIVQEPHVLHKWAKKEITLATLHVEANRIPEDVEEEAWDTTMVAEYGEDIFKYMHELEQRLKPDPYYMDHQSEMQWSMRAVLMDWLVQVHNRFTLLPETLFLAINLIDRFLSNKVVSLGKLQLVGATAIFVAAKYEEINCPSVQEIIYMVDGGYTMDEILKAERFMLTLLKFELGWPGPMSFLRRISKADDYDLETRTLAKYFLEVAIMDHRFVSTAPSFLAAGAHCLARLMLKKGDWTLEHVYYSGYTYWQLHEILLTLRDCCLVPRKHHAAVFDKYSDKRYKRCSLFVETEMQNGFAVVVNWTDMYGHDKTWQRKVTRSMEIDRMLELERLHDTGAMDEINRLGMAMNTQLNAQTGFV